MTATVSQGATYTARPRRAYAWIGAVVALALIVVVSGVVLSKRRPATVPAGLTMAGVAVGGLDQGQVRGVVESAVRARVGQPIAVRVSRIDRTFTVDPATAGMTLDVDATIRAAFAGATSAVIVVRKPVLLAALKRHDRAAVATRTTLAAPATGLDAKADASFTATATGVGRTPGTAGWTVDAEDAEAKLTAAAAAGRPAATLTATTTPPGTTPPALAGVDQLIGSFTTHHGCCAPRVTNIHLIARTVDGTVVAPGATFSLNQRAGERTRAKGYVAAPAIVGGGLQDQIGGGVSQFSTTLFNAVWFAGLPSLEHQPHTKYISRYPPGREATLDWDHIDNVFRNDTAAPVVIRTHTTGTSVTVALYGHTGARRVDSVTGPRSPAGANGGFSVSVTRTIHDDDHEARATTVRWTYDGLD